MTFNPIQVISIIAIFQSIFLSLHFLGSKNGDKVRNRLLSIFLFCFAILMGVTLTMTTGLAFYFLRYHKLIFLVREIGFLIGPLLYFFVKQSVNEKERFLWRDLLHLVPFFLSFIYYGYELTLRPFFIIWLSKINVSNLIVLFLHNLIYVIASFRTLMKKKFSLAPSKNNGGVKRSWLFLILSGTIVIWFIQLNSLFILHVFNYYKYCPNMTSLYSASTFVFVNAIAFAVISKPELFNRGKKYQKSILKDSEKKAYQTKLIQFMEQEKPFLNPTLSLMDLSNALVIPHRELSQIINEGFQLHFYDFINRYRVVESQEYLKDQSNGDKTILDIAFFVGFNSKSAFNTAFKKHTGTTPKQFRTDYRSP